MLEFLTSKQTIHRLLNLRSAAIIVQCALILLVVFGLNYELNLVPIFFIILAEILFNSVCILIFRSKSHVNQHQLLVQHLADIVFLTMLLQVTGGATNAFVSLLLIPIALSAVTLTIPLMVFVTGFAVAAYSLLLFLMPTHALHNMNMQQHFVGMWMNFLFSAGVVSLVVGQMSREINKRERAIANFREEYLKQEQVIALGVASAQVTHQLATPITTVQLLADELSEELPDNPILRDMQHELTRCRKSIDEFRQLALDTKAQKCSVYSCQHIVDVLQEQININFPRAQLLLTGDFSLSKSFVYADASLTPAILNLIQNGIRASLDNGSQEIELLSEVTEARWRLTIRDFGKGFSKNKLTELGATLVESHQGLGMAVFLSHASLERLGGKLTLANHIEGGAVVTVQLPLVAHEV